MTLCSRCKKRIAVVFMTRLENGETKSEGLCLKCAKELGIGPVNDVLQKMGIDDEQLAKMDEDMEQYMQESSDLTEEGDDPGTEDSDEGRAPAVDFGKMMQNLPFSGMFGLSGGKQNTESAPAEEKTSEHSPKKKKRKFLDAYCVDLTKRASEGKLDPVIGREREIARMIQILCRRQKNNPCLIGEPGVGKTAIAEALAQKIVAGTVPERLSEKEVLLLDMTALVAGTQFRGQFESRMKGLIEEIKSFGNIILVIDEVHTLAGAGDAEGSMNAANILKPALSRGEIQVIGATTLKEYRKYIEKDAALERRFQPIIVEEPSVEDTVSILKGIKPYYESFHGIRIPDEMVRRTVLMSERYITDRFLPDKSIDLLDEAAAYTALHSPVVERLMKLEKALNETRANREALENSTENGTENEEKRYETIAELKSQELQQVSELNRLSEEREGVMLTVDALAHVIEVWTGIPASTITEQEFERLEHLGDRIRRRIVGQDEAVDAVVRAVKRNRAGVSFKKKPVSFIFAGPTGVGKTELVKTLARELFHTPDAMVRLDMSEYMEKYSVSRMIGSPPGYVGYDDAGQLTEKIRRKPYSVILFDEIEKAHPDVLNIMLQILDDGRLTDAQGREVNFENTVIVMTTNAGSVSNDNTAGFTVSAEHAREEKTEKALLSFLRPEFINRVDEIITFRALEPEDFEEIARIMLGELVSNLGDKDIRLIYTEEAVHLIATESFSRKYGARNMRRYIQTHVEDAIANCLISGYNREISAVTVSVERDEAGKESICVTV